MGNPAETYEREMVPVLFAPWAPLLLDLAAPQSDERVLDVACGSGIVARQAARRMGGDSRITGLDINPGMLAAARDAAVREGFDIEWKEGAMEALPFADGAFDLVLCQHGLQFSPSRGEALAGMHRVLGAGGRLAIAVWQGLDRHPFWSTFNDALVRHIGIPALAAPFDLGRSEDLHALLTGAGFRDVTIEARSIPARFPDPEGFVAMEVDVVAAAIPATQHLGDAARRALTSSISQEMASAISALVVEGQVTIPMHAHLALATR